MRNGTMLGLSGLILAALVGCETNRPYSGRYVTARNTYGQADTAYRPRTTVTMRAEEVPENPTATQTCPAVQVISPTGATVVQTAAQGSGSGNMVTVNIPAMKIVIPMSAVTANSVTASSTPQVQEVSSVSHLPPASGSVVHADSKSSTSSSAFSSSPPDIKVQSPVHAEKEEPVSASPKKLEMPPMPEPVKESKPTSESKPISKTTSNDSDSHQPRLSLLPPEPPPEVRNHRTPAAASPSRKSIPEMPPPPPPIPKSADAGGPALPSADPEIND